MFSPQLGLHEVFGASADVQEVLQSGRLILDDRWLMIIILQCLNSKSYIFTGEKEIRHLCRASTVSSSIIWCQKMEENTCYNFRLNSKTPKYFVNCNTRQRKESDLRSWKCGNVWRFWMSHLYFSFLSLLEVCAAPGMDWPYWTACCRLCWWNWKDKSGTKGPQRRWANEEDLQPAMTVMLKEQITAENACLWAETGRPNPPNMSYLSSFLSFSSSVSS